MNPSLNFGVKPNALSFFATLSHPNFTTSTGSGKENELTIFDSSTTIISFIEQLATIFSLSKAPPPPFIKFNFPSTWSAPSIVTSMSCSFNGTRGIPASFASFSVSLDVAIPLICKPSFTISPIFSIAYFVVEPVPSPTIIPSFT